MTDAYNLDHLITIVHVIFNNIASNYFFFVFFTFRNKIKKRRKTQKKKTFEYLPIQFKINAAFKINILEIDQLVNNNKYNKYD